MQCFKLALPFNVLLWWVIFLIGFASVFIDSSARSEMLNELSDVQNAIFHLSPRNYEFTAETNKADQYIDDEQADFFISAAEPDLTLEADGNYPYSLVDHQIRDEDLEIVLDADHGCCPYPRVVYLSRDNIYQKEYNAHLRPPDFFVDNSYKNKYRHKFKNARHEKEYNNRLNPPGFFTDSHEMTEPFNNQRVTTTYWQLHDYEVVSNEVFRRSVTPGEDCITGYMIGGYALSRGCVNVWVSETRRPASCEVTERKEPQPAGKCKCSDD